MSVPSKEQLFLAQLAATVASGLINAERMKLGATLEDRYHNVAVEATAIAREILTEVQK